MKALFIGIFALICLMATIFMPWAELGLPQNIPGTSQIIAQFASLKSFLVSTLPLASKDKTTFDYYVYSIFLGLALVFSAIGISLIGREDAEEKTVIPAKK